MRSLETGRPMIRSTNTGITASIDHKGRILESLEPMKSDFLLTKVQGTKGQTIYNITTDYIILVLSSIVLLYTFITSNKNLYSRIIKKLDHK